MEPEERSVHKFLSEAFLKEKDFANSHRYLDSCYKYYHFASDSDLRNISSPRNFDKVLKLRSEIFLAQYDKTDSISYLLKAEKCFDQIRELGLLRIASFSESKNKLQLYQNMIDHNAKSIEVLNNLLEITHEEKYLHKMLDVSEMNKNLLLYFTIKQNDFVNEIPQDLIDSAMQIKLDLTQIDNLIFENGATPSLLDKKLVKTLDYDRISVKLRSYHNGAVLDFPNGIYQAIKHNIALNTSLLEYAFTEQFVFIFVLNKERLTVQKVRRDPDLIAALDSFERTMIIQRLADISQKRERYIACGYKIYKELVLPVQSQLKEKVTLVVEDALQGIPFDALLSSLPGKSASFHEFPYLLRKHTFNYAFSATILLDRARIVPKFENSLLIVAPFTSNERISINTANERSSFGKLKNSYIEAIALQKIYQGDTILGRMATKANFLSKAATYQNIHIASHSLANRKSGEYSYIVFAKSDEDQQQILYANDIYQLRLNTDLLVLSSCESGAGEELKGEGFNSLSRAFSYAGVKNIVHTLWKVNDTHTQKIMTTFYKHLKEAEAKADALHLAKVNFLNTETSVNVHPFYWSTFKLFSN